MINVGVSVKIQKKIMHVKKITHLKYPATRSCEIGTSVVNIIDDSLIAPDGIIDKTKIASTKTVPTNFNEKR